MNTSTTEQWKIVQNYKYQNIFFSNFYVIFKSWRNENNDLNTSIMV